MTRVVRSPDCGNSPKNLFVQKLTIALATGNATAASRCVTDDVEWVIAGRTVIRGKAALAAVLERAAARPPAEVTVHHVVSHGKAGAADGTIRLANGKLRVFCDMVEFSTARGTAARRITSYDVAV